MAFPHPTSTVDEAANIKGVAEIETNQGFVATISTTASLNNQGVECFRAGEWTQALNLFRSALRSSALDCAADGVEMEACEQWDTSIPVTLADQVVSLQNSVSNDFLSAVGFYLNPFVNYFGSDKVHNCALQSAVVWYNLGLLLHVKSCNRVVSVESDDNMGARLRLDKALSLYMRTKSVLEVLGVFVQGSNDGSPGILHVLGMATLNNLAYALYQKERWTASQDCLLDMTQWILQIEKQFRTAQSVSATEVASWEVFEWMRSSCLLNAMILQPPCVAGAA